MKLPFRLSYALVLLVIPVILTNCSSVSFLVGSEASLIGRVGLAMEEGGAVTVASESRLASAFSEAFSLSRKMGNLTLTLSLEGLTAEFEIVGPSLLRRTATGAVIKLPGRIARIANKATVSVKITPESAAKAFKTLNENRPVIILETPPVNGYSKVRFDEFAKDGWVETKYLDELYKTPEEILDEYSANRKKRETVPANCQSTTGNIVILIQNSSKWHSADPSPILNTFTLRVPKFIGAARNEDFYYSTIRTDVPATMYQLPEGDYTYEMKRFFGGSGSYQGWFANEPTISAGTIRVVRCVDNQLTIQK